MCVVKCKYMSRWQYSQGSQTQFSLFLFLPLLKGICSHVFVLIIYCVTPLLSAPLTVTEFHTAASTMKTPQAHNMNRSPASQFLYISDLSHSNNAIPLSVHDLKVTVSCRHLSWSCSLHFTNHSTVQYVCSASGLGSTANPSSQLRLVCPWNMQLERGTEGNQEV